MAINDSESPQASAKPEQPKYDDPNNPLYFHHSDQPGVVLVTQLLNDENYPTWSRSMLMVLNTKNKEGFVDGTLKKPLHDSSTTLQQWTRCNNLVKSWLLNSISPYIGASIIYNDVASDIWNDLKERFSHANSVHLFHIEQEIHDCVQGTMTIGAYYTKLKGLWDARDALCSHPSCNCGAAKEMFQFHQHQKTMKFLMGLNDVYAGVRGQILLIDPFPAVNKAFSLITQDEKQRAVSTHALGKTPATNAAALAVHGPRNSGRIFSPKNPHLKCERCDATVHTSDTCREHLKCDYCGWRRHTIDQCRKLKKAQSNSGNSVRLLWGNFCPCCKACHCPPPSRSCFHASLASSSA